MGGLTIPLFLIFAGLAAALMAYRNIRRGGARFYTLEREAILRQASISLVGSILLFLLAVSLLVYERQQEAIQQVLDSGEFTEGVPMATPTFSMQTEPPTPTPTGTPDPDEPTPVPTIVICRAIVQGTAGSGLALRQTPGGDRLSVQPEGTILTLITDETPATAGQYTWVKVRAPNLEEGWVATEFLMISNPDCLPSP